MKNPLLVALGFILALISLSPDSVSGEKENQYQFFNFGIPGEV